MAALTIPVQVKTATASGQTPTSLLNGELGLDPWLGRLWWADNNGNKQFAALPAIANAANAAQADDVRQLMIQMAKLRGSVTNYVSGFADDYADQSGVDFDSYTKALLHFDGANGSTTFSDDVGHTFNGFGGSCSISTAQSVFGGSALRLPGGSSYLACAANADFGIGTADFTMEFRWRPDSVTADSNLTDTRSSNASSVPGFNIFLQGSSGKMAVYDGLANSALIGSTVLTAGTWYTIAVTRTGGTLRLFVNGNLDASASNTSNWGTSQPLYIGTNVAGASNAVGYMDDFRYTLGLARYTAAYTPATAAFALSSGSGFLYDATNKLYTNSSREISQSLPAMTGNSAPSGSTASASSNNASAYLAFDQNIGTSSNANNKLSFATATNEYVQRTFTSAITAAGYQVSADGTAGPASWTLYGSNDGGSTLVPLDSQSGVTWGTNPSTVTYPIAASNVGSYTTYRLLCRTNGGYSYTILNEFGILQAVTTALDLRSVAVPVSFVPSKASIFILVKPLNGATITPNTNLIASVSRTRNAASPTWTQVTLVAAGTVGGFTAYEANNVDVTGQPSGQSLGTRLQTANGLAIQAQANVMQAA